MIAKPKNPYEIVLSIKGGKGTAGKWKNGRGATGFMANPNPDAVPTGKRGLIQFLPGQSLQTLKPVTAPEKTFWMVVRKTGNPNVDPNYKTHYLLTHGNFSLCAIDHYVHLNDGQGVLKIPCVKYSEAGFCLIIVRYSSTKMQIHGMDKPVVLNRELIVTNDFVRIGQDGGGWSQYSNMEIKAAGFATTYFSDETIAALALELSPLAGPGGGILKDWPSKTRPELP